MSCSSVEPENTLQFVEGDSPRDTPLGAERMCGLLCLFVSCVLVTPTTILLVLDAPCLLLLVFCRGVVSPLALSTF